MFSAGVHEGSAKYNGINSIQNDLFAALSPGTLFPRDAGPQWEIICRSVN